MLFQQELVNDPRFKQAFEGVTLYGIAGANGSGKDTIMEALEEAGFYAFNVGDALRQISLAVLGSTKRGGNNSPTGKIANAQRSIYPGGMVTVGLVDYWTKVLHMPGELQPQGIVIGSIRGVGEVETLKAFGGKLIVATASEETRYHRLTHRGRGYEARISFEQFVEEERAEMGYGETDPTKFGMAKVIEMADISIDNDSDNINDFKNKIRHMLGL